MRQRSGGFLLITALLLSAFISILSSLGLLRSQQELLIAHRYGSLQRAFHAAEAGVDEALGELAGDRNFSIGEGWTDASTDPACQPGATCRTKTLTLAEATASVTILDATGPTPVIRSDGASEGLQQTLEVVMTYTGGWGFPPLFGRDRIVLGSDVRVDAYNSDNGPRSATNKGPIQSVRSNSVGIDQVVVGNGAKITGDVLIGPGGDPATTIALGVGATITGSQGAAAEPFTPPTVPLQSGSSCGTNTLSVTAPTAMAVAEFQAGCYGRVTIAGTARLTLVGDGTIHLGHILDDLQVATGGKLTLDGNITMVLEDLVLGNQTDLKVTSEHEVSLYVTGKVAAGEGSQVNSLLKVPSAFSLYYTGTTDVLIGNDGKFYGALYAPEAAVAFGDRSDVWGALGARELSFGEGVDYHYDEALETATGLFTGQASIRSWRQP